MKNLAIILGCLGLLLVFASACMLVGARAKSPATTAPVGESAEPVEAPAEPTPNHDELVARLILLCNEKGLYFHIWCTAYWEGQTEKYAGLASAGSDLNIYAEDGAGPYWRVHDNPTQDAAMVALLKVLNGPPNTEPQHKRQMERACKVPDLVGVPISAQGNR
jgi:hypothetical protein